MKIATLTILLATLVFQQAFASSLDDDFRNPPQATRPFVYWYWVNNNVSKAGVCKDLQAMADIGIGGVYIGQIGYKDDPKGNVPIFSGQWWDCMTTTMEEAERLGIQVNLFNSPGWSGTGGAWVKPQQAMRYLDVHQYPVTGPRKLVMPLPDYKSAERFVQDSLSFHYIIDKSTFKFQPVALQAFPAPKGSDEAISARHPTIQAHPEIENVEALFDGNESTTVSISRLPTTIELSLKEPLNVRSLEIVPTAPSKAWCRLEYLDSAGTWQTVVSRQIIRSENRIIVSGWAPFAPVAVCFPAVNAQKFRLTFTEDENAATPFSSKNGASKDVACLAEIKLSGAALVDSYPEKELANKANYKNECSATLQAEDSAYAIRKTDVRNLTACVDTSGFLTWDVPAGDWIIQYSGMLQTGVPIHPVPEDPTCGFATDILNKQANQASFDAYIGRILKHIPPEKRKALTGIWLDSYEQGSCNWTDGLCEKFQAAYGYDPLPWLPVLNGDVVESAEQSDRFLWDLRRLIADLMPENFPGALQEMAHQNGLIFGHEPYAGHGFPGECLLFGKNEDQTAGEFWLNVPLGSNFPECRAASSVARIYGCNTVSAEAFTSGSNLYKAMPRDLKASGDWAMAQGVNHFILHLYVHQPDDQKPGINTWYGTEFNRNNNWFQDGKTYIDYLRRCFAMLQAGQRQADIAFYIGDNTPCDGTSLPYALPRGYDLDFLNYDVLLNHAKVEQGRLVLSSGASYRLLVLPPVETMRPELLQKLESFVKAGLIVYGPRLVRSPSLKGFPGCDVKLREIASRLWGNIDSKTIVSNRYGDGTVFFGPQLADVLPQIDLSPAVFMPDDFGFTYRKSSDADTFFIANQKAEARTADISFHITGKQPELWNPLTGEHRELGDYSVVNGRTVIPLQFDPDQSWFLVFRKPFSATPIKQRNFPTYVSTQVLSGNWKVDFASSVNPSFSTNFDQLIDWTSSTDARIKYFCGKATYTLHFDFDGKLPGSWFLNMGRVESLAKVRLNGHPVATLWCYPYRVNISEYLVKGDNKLEVEMVNQWWNQLIGDEQPEATPKTTVSARLFWKATDSLVPSGLLGPVVLEEIKP